MVIKNRKPIIAFSLSLIEPGTGFVYLGKFKTGLLITLLHYASVFMSLFMGVLESFVLLVVFFALYASIRLGVAIYVLTKSSSIRSIPLHASNRGFVYLAFLLLPIASRFILDLSKPILPTIWYTTPTSSMEPTVNAGECFIVDQHFYESHELKPGDIILFRIKLPVLIQQEDHVNMKRVVARGGQEVKIRDGVLFVNNERILPLLRLKRRSNVFPAEYKERIIFPPGAGNGDQYGPVVVPDNKLFVLGDFRDNSVDSRYFGFVDSSAIVGKPLYIYWSDDDRRIGNTIE